MARWTATSAAASVAAVVIGGTLLFALAFSNGPGARTPASVLERDGPALAAIGGGACTVYAFVTTLGLGTLRRLRRPAPSAPADAGAP